MRNLYSDSVRLMLALFFIATFADAQILNEGFVSPLVLRQGYTQSIRQAPGGKLYVLGDFIQHGNYKVGKLVRLNADGTLDQYFNPPLPEPRYIPDFEVLTDGNVICISANGYTGEKSILLINPNGQILQSRRVDDATALEAAPAGGFFLGDSEGFVARYSSDFMMVNSVNGADGRITDIKMNGTTVVVSGDFSKIMDVKGQWHDRKKIARFNISGGFDGTFNANAAMTDYGPVHGVLVQADGKVLPLNLHQPLVYSSRPIRLDLNGSLDTGFSFPFPSNEYLEHASHVNGSLYITTKTRFARLNTDGSVDASFAQIRYPGADAASTVLPDGSPILGNYAPATYGFAKFTPSGVRVNEYYARLMRYGEIYSMDRSATSIYIGGDFIKVGAHFTRNVARLNPNGTVLTKFVGSILKPVLTLEVYSASRILVNTTDLMYRLKADVGTVDPTFVLASLPGSTKFSKFIVQGDGKILVGKGYRLFRLNANGSQDNTFNAEAGLSASGNGKMEFDLDRATGKIIYSAYYLSDPAEYSVKELKRLNPNGSNDPTFHALTQEWESYSGINTVLALDNQQALLASTDYFAYKASAKNVVKVQSDGSVDEEFFNNFPPYSDSFHKAARFGDRIILASEYNPYSRETFYTAMFMNALQDEGFVIPARTVTVNRFYSDNSSELFILGQSVANGKQYQIAKVTFNASAPANQASSSVAAGGKISFYPNPVRSQVTIDVSEPTSVQIYDHSGNRRTSATVDGTNNTISLEQLPSGTYIIEMKNKGFHYRDHLIKD